MSRGSAALMPPLWRLLLALFLPNQEKGVNAISSQNCNLLLQYRIGRSGEMLNGPKARVARGGIPTN